MSDSIKELLRFHVDESRKRHDELKKDLKEDIQRLSEKMDGFAEFKTRTLVNARWVSIIVSTAFGIASVAVSAIVNAYIRSGH